MKVTIRDSAEDDLDRIFAWIAKDHPRTAAEMVSRIRDRIGLLEANNLAHMGRRARHENGMDVSALGAGLQGG